MKLATLKDGSRDGQLVVVSRDLTQAHFATGIATRLQHVLDDWNFVSPPLHDLYTSLNHGKARHAFAFDPTVCMAPLPRAYQCLMQADAWSDPVAEGADAPSLLPCASDDLLNAQSAVAAGAASAAGPQWSAQAVLMAITGDVPREVDATTALSSVRLLALACAWRDGTGAEQGPQEAQPEAREQTPYAIAALSFAPVVVTPDESGLGWADGRLTAGVTTGLTAGQRVGGRPAGHTGAQVAGPGPWHLGQLIATAARRRRVRAGSLVGGPWAAPWLGGAAHIEALDAHGLSLFGAIAAAVRVLPMVHTATEPSPGDEPG